MTKLQISGRYANQSPFSSAGRPGCVREGVCWGEGRCGVSVVWWDPSLSESMEVQGWLTGVARDELSLAES